MVEEKTPVLVGDLQRQAGVGEPVGGRVHTVTRVKGWNDQHLTPEGLVWWVNKEGLLSTALSVGRSYTPITVQTDNALKVRFSTKLGQEPEVEVALV
jgi:hypothetical protein